MRRSKFYNMRLPERGAREGEANDAADIEDLTYDLGIIDAEMERQRLEDVRLEKDKATKLEMSQHKSAAVLDHPDSSVTDAKLGQRTVLTTRGPLQTLLTAIGNAVKAISGASTWNGAPATTLKDAKTHMDDAVKHITAQEREGWNAAATDRHSHTNKSVLDGITAAMVTAWNTVSSKLPLAGGTLTGFLTLHAAPATDMHAATKKYVDDKMAASGSGDMTKAVYDPGGRELPYIPKQDVDALAWGGDFGASGAPVSIAYAGAQRIASITAYGENAQGGTTDAPVALTGVDSAILFEQHTPINLAKPITADRYGVSVITNADGSVTVKGTATDETWPRPVEVNIPSAIIAGDITISLSSPASVKMQFQVMTPDGRKESYGLSAGSTSITVKIKSGYTGMHIFLSLLPDQTIDETFHIMIAQGTEPVPFVPYVEPSITHLPIPRPLHKVGDVRDICRTRVKSVYDKRIVLDGTENWNISSSKPNSFLTPVSERIMNGLSDSYPTLKSPEIGTKNGIYLNYTEDIIVTDLACSTVEEFKAHLSAHPLTVYYRSTAYDGTNGLEVCLTEYQNGFVELDGTEGIEYQSAYNRFAYTLPSTAVNDSGFCSHYKKLMTSAPGEDKYIVIRPEAVYFYDSQYTNADAFNAYLAAQKEAGTPVQVAYQLAAPETYATDPLDIDNAAGPLTVMTGGEVEVRMTELVGSRTYDADGDGVVDRANSVDGGTY